MTPEQIYAKKCLADSGINFDEIPKDNILMTCQEYNGIISKMNYRAILCAIDNIYEDACYKEVQNLE